MDAIAPRPAPVNSSTPLIQPYDRQLRNQIRVTPLEKRLKAYERFERLVALGTSRKQIVRRVSRGFGISQPTVYAWIKGVSPLGRRAGRIAYTKELFYVIGALLGDGCIYHWNKSYMIWLLGEMEFCQKYASIIPSCTNKTKARAYPNRGRNVWFVKFDNAELFFLIRQIRGDLRVLSDLLRQGNRFANALELIGGFFDAEGCVRVIKEAVRKTPKINLDFCNTNLALLQLIGRELKATLEIEPHFTSEWTSPNRKVTYHLRIYKKDAIRRFLSCVPTIKLKPEKERYVKNWLRKREKER